MSHTRSPTASPSPGTTRLGHALREPLQTALPSSVRVGPGSPATTVVTFGSARSRPSLERAPFMPEPDSASTRRTQCPAFAAHPLNLTTCWSRQPSSHGRKPAQRPTAAGAVSTAPGATRTVRLFTRMAGTGNVPLRNQLYAVCGWRRRCSRLGQPGRCRCQPGDQPGSRAAAGLLVAVLHSPRGRARLQPVAAFSIRVTRRLLRRRPGGTDALTADALTASALARLGAFNLSRAALASAFGWALANWAADTACLAAAIAAIGVPVPWRALLLAWGAGSAAASFSPTPYGLGIVDIALIAALHATGLTTPDAVGAVLLYRVITFKIIVTLLWIGYRYLHNTRRAA